MEEQEKKKASKAPMEKRNNFFAALQSCSTGERAVLRRNCGRMLREADGEAVILFYRCLPVGVPPEQESYWFAAACFSCLWQSEEQGVPLETIFPKLADESDSMAHRLASLLDLHWESDGFLLRKLCRIVKMARAKGIPVDCEKLLNDLLFWNSIEQSVQRKWARAMYRKDNSDK